MLYRQGDVFVKKVDRLPNGNQQNIERDKGRIVLAYGEVTGHAHAIKDKNACLLKIDNKVFLTVIDNPVDLSHEEHSTITLPVGNYEVIRQKQYTPSRSMYAAD